MGTIETVLERLNGFPSRLLLAIHGIAEDDLRIPEREGAWSVLDVIAHLSDFELLTAWRLRLIVATEDPQLPSVSQNAFVTELHRGRGKAELVRELTQLRQMNAAMASRFTPQQLERKGEHSQYGTLTALGLLERAVAHQEKHLGQIERIVSAHAFRREAIDVRGAEAVVAAGVAPRPGGPENIRVRQVWRDGFRHAQFVEIDPGARFPGTDHHVPGPEEVYVAAGVFHDGVHEYGAGTFVHYPAGSSHVPQSESGCALFLFYPEG